LTGPTTANVDLATRIRRRPDLATRIRRRPDLATRIRRRVGFAARMAAALVALATLAAAVPSIASADPPTRITIVASFDPIRIGENAFVNGQLLGAGQAGQIVALEQSPPPFTTWTPVAEAITDWAGYYSFKLHPAQTMEYRTSSQGLQSERVVQVAVTPRIAFKATFTGRSSIRFSGTFAPALPGQVIAVQRRVRSGWRTVATVRLRSGRSFEGRMRARRSTTLRASFVSDGAHLSTHSRTITARP
jgi:hypothetical protein